MNTAKRVVLLSTVLALAIIAGVSAKEIYVPPPKDAPGEAVREKEDVIVLTNGDTLSGNIVGTDEKGCVTVRHKLIGADVPVPIASARTIMFSSGKGGVEEGRDSVLVTNGDSMTGIVKKLSKDSLTLETAFAGTLDLNRRMIRSVSIGSGGRVVLDEDFSEGMGKAVPHSGSWEVANEALCQTTHGAYYASFQIQQTGAMMYEWDMSTLDNSQLNAGVAIYCSGTDQVNGNDSYYAYLSGSNVYINRVRNRRDTLVINKNLRKSYPSARCRIEYDPESGLFFFTVNNEVVAEYKDASPLRKGNYFVLSASQPTSFDNIRIMKGGKKTESNSGEAADEDVVFFANGDRTSGAVESISDRGLSVRTSYGPLDVDLDKVDSIVFGSNSMEEPRRRAGDAAVVLANHDRLTVDISSLDAAELKGHMDCTGLVTLKRSTIRSMKFHIYEE